MKIYTHAGRFHADEVLATAMLIEWGAFNLPNEQVEIFRLNDIKDIPTDGFILDIGREYSPEKKRFDHHQEFLTREDGYPYATAGLIWKHFGNDIHFAGMGEGVHEMVDERFIKGVDAHDSDAKYHHTGNCSAGEVQVITFSQIIASMNFLGDVNSEEQNVQFNLAVEFAQNILREKIYRSKEICEAKGKVAQSQIKVAGNSSYYQFDEGFPWHEAVCSTKASYVILPSQHPGNPISLLAVPVEPGSRVLKKPIERPDWFDGFIHNGRFIAGCATVDQAIKLIESQQ